LQRKSGDILAKVDPDFPEEKKFKTEDLVSLPTSAAEDDLRLFRSPHQQHHHQSEERRLTSPTTPNGSGRFLDRFPFLTGVDGFVSLHHDAVVIPLSLFLSLSLSLSLYHSVLCYLVSCLTDPDSSSFPSPRIPIRLLSILRHQPRHPSNQQPQPLFTASIHRRRHLRRPCLHLRGRRCRRQRLPRRHP
jgi:hypothetical protein